MLALTPMQDFCFAAVFAFLSNSFFVFVQPLFGFLAAVSSFLLVLLLGVSHFIRNFASDINTLLFEKASTMKRFLTYILAFVIPFLSINAQETEEQYVDTVFHDNIDRTAEDFVTASLCICDPTDWHNDFLGVLGHAFIRLQCPSFNMDYCFSYEAENAETEKIRFLKGELRMGMFRIPTEEYIQTFKKWNCAIHEYQMNLPPDVKQQLWKVMDDKVSEGQNLELDLIRRGCTQTLVQFVEAALGDNSIQYGDWPAEYKLTRRQIISEKLNVYPWIRFLCSDLLMNTDFSEVVPNEQKILYPEQLLKAWQNATVNGKPIITYKGDLIKAERHAAEQTWFTPMVLALLILALAIAAVLLRRCMPDSSPVRIFHNTTTYSVLILQSLVGLLLLWLVMMSTLPGTKGAHLLPLYTPLPLLLWRWHKYWCWIYLGILLLWVIAMCVLPNIYVEPAHFVLAAAITVLVMSDKLAAYKK